MRSVYRVSKNNWLVNDRTCSYLVTLFSSGESHQVCIGEVNELLDECFSLEVYSMTFVGVSPQLLVDSLLLAYSDLEDPSNPVELVYQYGGTVRSSFVPIPKLWRSH